MIRATLHTQGGKTDVMPATWQGDIIQRGYTAFIFDCDGTLVHSSDAHFASFHGAATDQGFALAQEWYLARTGFDRLSLFREFARAHPGFDIDAAVLASIARFIEISDQVRPIPEIKSLVATLAPSYPLAVGTNAEKSVAEASLRATGMLQYFNHVVAINDVSNPKPAPDIFLRAAQLLGASPARTLVFEDSPQGVAAAMAAGMDVVEVAEP